MTDRMLTPSKITAWLDCAHYLTLKHEVETGGRPAPAQSFGSFARLLQQKGLEHEAKVLARYEREGLRVLLVDGKAPSEMFADWAHRVRPSLEADADVLFQVPFIHDGIRGVADFLERGEAQGAGSVCWEPVDAKLARSQAKPGHVLQLCFYAEALAAITGMPPQSLKVALGSGTDQLIGFEDVRPYWERLRLQLRVALDADPTTADTRPVPCDHCAFCEFQPTCEATWREADSLAYVAGISATERASLEQAGVAKTAALAVQSEPVAGIRIERVDRLRQQASLQVLARERPDDKPPFALIELGDDPMWGHGFEQLPEPDPGDVFLDYEGHPFWRPERGLFFLFGYLIADETGEWGYHALWADDEATERDCVEELVRFLTNRHRAAPGMHVYHYNHTERSALEALAAEHAVAESALADLVDTGVFVDLLLVARNAVQVGVEGYGLKLLERLTDYERHHEIDKGAGAVIAFEQYQQEGDPGLLQSIEIYNEDDVRATRALRDWLIYQRPRDLPWRVAQLDAPAAADDVDSLLERLTGFGIGTEQHLLADLLGYWLREWRAYIGPLLVKLAADQDAQLTDSSVLTGLGEPVLVDRVTPTGRPAKWPGLRLMFPPQQLDRAYRTGALNTVLSLGPDGSLVFIEVAAIDVAAGTIDLVWNGAAQERGIFPGSVVVHEWVGPSTKRTALTLLANMVIEPASFGAPNPVTIALLRGDPPAFIDGRGPAGGLFSDDVNELAGLVVDLDRAVLGVQGPPGTGKTYRGAHMAKALVAAGKRVGIMAMSHAAIDNFLAEIVEVFSCGQVVELRAARYRDEPPGGGLPGVKYVKSTKALISPDYDVVAGTAWQFASEDLRSSPVDVLLIDEAGQLALVDAVAGSMAARSLVLLGDPQQLPQVAQAVHPRQSGASALGHLLGDADAMRPERGVFIEETRRMHPDVCRFISDRMYAGRLSSHPDCALQGTDAGTGLRWLRAEHAGCSTESVEEAELISAQLADLMGRSWTNKEGVSQSIGVDDVIVVAPYNDQVRLLRNRLNATAATRGIPVGTVDKFQGRQAPVVFFTMTSSSAADMPRGTEFLFSKNRLNVAVSRAQCLTYLVCTQTLLESRAKTVEDMLLIATLCAFVEYATS
jgi:predicted RecB family nuclease